MVAVRQIKTDSAKKGESARGSTNRPIIPEHVTNIQRYLEANRERYILPPLTLNVRDMPQLHVAKSNSGIRLGFMAIGDETSFYITDGQHRLKAIEEILDHDRELGREGVSVMIIVEPEIAQIHQDFADAAQTKPIPASLLAVYNTREPVNKVLSLIVSGSRILNGRIDETSKTLSKNSSSLFLLNQARQFVKELLMGDYAVSDSQLAVRTARDLSTEAQRAAFVQRAGDLLDVLSEHMEPWKTIVTLPKSGPLTNRIIDFRTEYINLTATGLVIIGRVAFEIYKTVEEHQWRDKFIRLAKDIDWKRGADIWKGTIVTSDGKILTNRRPISLAAERVKDKIDIGQKTSSFLGNNE